MRVIITEGQYSLLREKYSDRPFNPIKTAISNVISKTLGIPQSTKQERELYTKLIREIENGNFQMVKEPVDSHWGFNKAEVKVILDGQVYLVKPKRERGREGASFCSVEIFYGEEHVLIWGCSHFKKITELIVNKSLIKVKNTLSKLPLILRKLTNGEIEDVKVEPYYGSNSRYLELQIKVNQEILENNSISDLREKYGKVINTVLKSMTGAELNEFKIGMEFF